MGEPAVEPLIEILKDKDTDVCKSVVGALGRLGDVRAVESLIVALKDHRTNWISAWTLGELRAKSAIKPLITMLNDKAPIARRDSAWALGETGDEIAISHLIPLLNDPVRKISDISLQSLRKIDTPRALAAVHDCEASHQQP